MAETMPVLIDPESFARPGSSTEQTGPYPYNGKLYLIAGTVEFTPRGLFVFESTDGGLTWAKLATLPFVIAGYASCRNGNLIEIVSFGAGNVLYHSTFDMAARALVGSPVSSGDLITTPLMARLAAGDFVVSRVAGPEPTWTTYSGGWGGTRYNDAGGASTTGYDSLVLDGTTAHLLRLHAWAGVGPNINPVYYRQIDTATGIATPETLVYTPLALFGKPKLGRGAMLNGKLYFPFSGVPVSGGNPLLCAVIDPVGLTVTVETVHNEAHGVSSSYPNYACVVADGILYLFYIAWHDTLYVRTRNEASGVWSDPEIVHDEVNHPVDPENASSFLHIVAPVYLGNGQFGISVGIDDLGYCMGYYVPYGGPYTPPPTGPCLPPMTLMKIAVTLRPATHLPRRGTD